MLRKIIKYWPSTNSDQAYEPNSFVLLFIGYTISQLPWAFMGSKAGLLANLWFKPNEISLATSIASTGQILGMGLGFFLPPFFIQVNSQEISNLQVNQTFKNSSLNVSGMFQNGFTVRSRGKQQHFSNFWKTPSISQSKVKFWQSIQLQQW